MSKILIIEPHKMLRHAFAVALSPEHEIEIFKMFPSADALLSIDVAIIDATALRERAQASVDLNSAANWKVPIIWIDDKLPEGAENMLCLKPPIDREALKRAVAQSTARSDHSKSAAKSTSRAPSQPTAKSQTKSVQSAGDEEKKFIELVDVVE